MSFDINNFEHYSKACLKIQTKSHGLQPFKLRKYQLRYIDHLKNDFKNGIIRSIIVKPRQCGFSTLIAGYNTHKMCTNYSYRGIVMADKYARTQAVQGVYSTMVDNLPAPLTPMIAKKNENEILFDNPDPNKRATHPGLSSGFLTETAQDADAGKSSSRQFAHLSEFAFYPYAMELDQSVQNSIPLASGTAIFKESTSNGISGNGEAFYQQYMAAERSDSIYKPWFVSWFEVDDYQMEVPRGFILTKEEVDLVKRCPAITNANLMWRRMKIMEIHTSDDSGLSPSELFVQDFPSWPEQSFLATGRPVFDMAKIKEHIEDLRKEHVQTIKLAVKQPNLSMYADRLVIYETPIKGMKYSIGADVSEGLSVGDASSAKILNENMVEVGLLHGQIDPDRFGRCLVELARIYNNAIITPEINSMGHSTLEAIKQMGYLRVYMRSVHDELEDSKETAKLGWRTSSTNKQKLLNGLVSAYRDGEIKIRDINLLREMAMLTREDNGNVSLNGRDRVVAACLAIVGMGQHYEKARVFDPSKKDRLLFETRDASRDAIIKKEIGRGR